MNSVMGKLVVGLLLCVKMFVMIIIDEGKFCVVKLNLGMIWWIELYILRLSFVWIRENCDDSVS